MKSIVVTGASGFVGKNLKSYFYSKKLATNFISIDKSDLYKSDLSLNYLGATVIHLAGKAHDLKNESNPGDYFKINTKLTEKVFDAFLNSPAKVFIFLSSVKAARDKVENILIENEQPCPTSDYGKSKLLAEEYILGKNLPQDKRVIILRPCLIHGPENKGNLNLLYKIVKKGIPWPLGKFENKRSFCSINNLCFVINEIIENENIESGIYNLADDTPLSSNQLIELISNSLNKKTKIYNIPKKIITLFAVVGDILNLPLNTDRLNKLTENYIVSNEKIIKAMGKNLPISSEEGLLMTFNYFNQK